MIKREIELPGNDRERRGYQQAMRDRCELQGHEWENCCSAMFQVYTACKWCGESP